ncbi:MAG: DUF1553 domain-containing protein [Planctomycetota bacterium]|nr:MAG: DUF1553 domain-containing protein [Planctomycetota bacterium]
MARWIVGLFGMMAALPVQAQALTEVDSALSSDSGRVEYFERFIRPALVEHCLDCHSTETEASGGLVLDSRSGWMTGGDSGPAIRPGDAEASLLMRAIGYRDPNLQMPPDGKLPEELIQRFRHWIAQGAFDPRTVRNHSAAQRPMGLAVERATEHWAYRPYARPAVPDATAGTAIDSFLNRKLAEESLQPAPSSPPAVIARRLYFDLTGLPPTPVQLRSAIELISQDRTAELVDRLLASPRFGEHFARHWMDVVRYAESITLRGFVLPEAWRFRDYLVDAFNEDRPFDQLICEQIAGDLMDAPDLRERQRQLVATGMLALGNTNLERQDKTQLEMDYIDEQLEVIGRAFLAQTIGCARCHDHKFDPIPTRDYYAMAGILRSAVGMEHDNVSKWIELPLPLDASQQEHFAGLESQLRDVGKQLEQAKRALAALEDSPRTSIALASLPGIVVDSNQARYVGSWTHSAHVRPYVGDGYSHDENTGKGSKTATFEPHRLPAGEYEVRLAYTPGPNRATNVPVSVFSANESQTVLVNQRRTGERGVWVSLGRYFFEEGGLAYVLVSNEGTDGHVIVDAVQFLPIGADEPGTPPADGSQAVSAAVAAQQAGRIAELRSRVGSLEREKKRLEAELARRPRYLTVVEKNPPSDIPIHIRGQAHNLGETVPRGVLTALTRQPIEIEDRSSGRLEMARWIAAADNPLSARVYANRIWTWLMGASLASDPNNFGTTVPPPTHPELLDWLAVELVEGGWSTKHLVRLIVLSEAYQRAIVPATPALTATDPDNRWYWRGHRKRIPVEAMRDAMLMVSGEIDWTMGGSLIRPGTRSDYGYAHSGTRRSLYHPVFRNALPPLYTAFDFADPSVSVGSRARSTVATQALVLINDPWVVQRASAAAHRLCQVQGRFANREDRRAAEEVVQQVYLSALCRSPDPGELQACVDYLCQASGDRDRVQRVARVVQAVFASLDFRYLD